MRKITFGHQSWRALAGVIASSALTMSISTFNVAAPALLLNFAATTPAEAMSCGTFSGTNCSNTGFQYAGGFKPNAGEYGGFGGGSCTATHTPVIFVHGNGDNASSWDSPPTPVPGYAAPPNSDYMQFKAAGYNDCELFGMTYLDSSERGATQINYHQESKYQIIENFIAAVKKYTGKSQVDIVTHSLGVSMSMATLTYYNDWGSVRRFVNIAGGLHGLDSCEYIGYANALAPTCGSQNIFDGYIFGFYPDGGSGINAWTGTSASYSLSNSAISHPGTSFYTIYAGNQDQFMCATISDYSICGSSPLIASASNVKSQLNVGAGQTALQVNWDWTLGAPTLLTGGDKNGVGHFHARNNTGKIIVNMLTTNCTGIACASGYTYGPVSAH